MSSNKDAFIRFHLDQQLISDANFDGIGNDFADFHVELLEKRKGISFLGGSWKVYSDQRQPHDR